MELIEGKGEEITSSKGFCDKKVKKVGGSGEDREAFYSRE